MSKQLVISDLGYSILGLLREQPGTGYEIRKVFETALLRRFSSSPGSIYPALARLERNKLVTKGGAVRGPFEITDSGRAALVEWLTVPVTAHDVEQNVDLLLLKFVFMEGLVTSDDRLHFLRSFAGAADELVDTLDGTRAATARFMPLHGRLTLEHQIAIAEVTRSWVRSVVREVQTP